MAKAVYNLQKLALQARKKWCEERQKEKEEKIVKVMAGEQQMLIREPGEQATITKDGRTIGWIVERIPCTTAAERLPFMAAVPSEYYGFKMNAKLTYAEAEAWVREEVEK